jgi:cell division transport system permease protein
VKAWLNQHWQTIAATAGKLAANPLNMLLNSLVIGVALALPVGGYIALDTLRDLAGGFSSETQLSVFLDLDTPRSETTEIQARLRKLPAVASVRFIPREQALARLKETEGIADVVASLGFNPLPDAYLISAKESGDESLARLAAEIKAIPKVGQVQADSAWAKRMDALLRLGRLGVLILAALLAAALVAVTFNTIRLQILTQRDEIEVAKFIGATNGFIRRPFFYLGAMQGALGGIAGCLIAFAGTWLVNRPLREFSQLYGSEFHLRLLSAPETLGVIGAAAVLGWAGAYLSVSKHLWQIEPN